MLRWLRLWTSAVETAPRRAAAIAAVSFMTALVVASVPRVLGHASDDALRMELTDVSTATRSLEMVQVGRIPANGTPDAAAPLGPVTDAATVLETAFPPPLPSVMSGTGLAIDTPHWRTTAGNSLAAVLRLRIQQDVAAHVSVTDGRLPSGATKVVPDPSPNVSGATITVFEAAVAAPAAAALAIHVGDRLILDPEPSDPFAAHRAIRLAVDLVGTYRVNDPADPFWLDDAEVGQPGIYALSGFTEYVSALALLAPEAYPALLDATNSSRLPLTYRFRSYVDPAAVDADEIGALSAAVRRAKSVYPPGAAVPVIGTTGVARASLHTGLGTILDDHEARWATASGVLAAVWGGVALTIVASLALVASAAARGRRASIAAVRSRGASRLQTVTATGAEALVLALPAAVLGTAAAIVLVPSRDARPAVVAGTVVVAATVALLTAASLRRGPSSADASRQPGAGTGRQVASLTLAGLALGGVLLLRQGASGTQPPLAADPPLAAVPALAGLVIGMGLAAIVGPLVGAAAARAGRGRGISGLLGWRRAALTAPRLLAVALATTGVMAFAMSLDSRIASGSTFASWQAVGADLAVSGPAPQLAALLAAPPAGGAGRGAGATMTGFAGAPAGLGVVVRDTPADQPLPVELARPAAGALAVVASADAAIAPGGGGGTPPPATPASGGTSSRAASGGSESVASPAPQGQPITIRLGSRDVPATVVGRIEALPGVPVDGPFLVLSRSQLVALDAQPPAPTVALLRAPGVSADVLRTALAADPGMTGLTVTSRAELEASLRDAPAPAAVQAAIGIGALVAVPYGALAIGIAILLAAAARRSETARLAVVGLSPGQTAGASIAESIPAVLGGTLGGVALGLAIAVLVEPGLGLDTLIGAPSLGPVTLDPSVLRAGLAAAATLIVVAALVCLAADRHPSASEVLRE